MRFISTLVLSVLSTLCFAQIAPSPDTPPGAQAAEAFAFAQAQSMITNQAQLQGLIAAQAALLPSAEAQSMFLAQAASLQAQSAANQENMFATQAASFNTMQFSLAQNQRQIQAAILSMRNQGIESASAMKDAVQVASLDPVKLFRRTAMLHAEAAQASGGSTPTQTTAKPSSPDAAPLRLEPPPMMIRPTFGDPLIVDKPTLSLPSGPVSASSRVSIRSGTHYATLYYTTNGWTPTSQSAKYTGPITINSNTHLEVIAVGPNFIRSAVVRADYQVLNSAAPVLESAVIVPEDGTVPAGTPVRVVFEKEVDSQSAAVGDEITVVLDEDIKLGNAVLAPKGTPVKAALTFADPGRNPAPGDLVFEIHSVDIAGTHVPLFGGETLEGVKGGKNATIKAGMTAMAFVAADTAIK